MESITTLPNQEADTGVQHSEQAVAVHSIVTDGHSLEEALEVAVLLVGCLAKNILSPDSLALAFMEAAKYCEGKEELLLKIHEAADGLRRSNPVSGMF